MSSSAPKSSTGKMKGACFKWTCVAITLCVAGIFFKTVYIAQKIFPEVGMVLNSGCSTPAPGWNGRIYGFSVWDNPAMKARNSSFSSYDSSSFLRRRIINAPNSDAPSEVIVVASHHKTGTILSLKIFARVCSIMKWCCVFHVTKDSMVAIQHSLATEPVKLMGHTQWAWNPDELGVPYRFVHFYRDPYKKVASGYRYHRDGVEAWCKKPLYYKNACQPPAGKKSKEGAVSTKEDVFKFCQSVHLCEPCCRIEHERRHASPAIKSAHAHNTHSSRSSTEYDFICKHLSGVNESLMTTLETVELSEAVKVEASVDYYENLRMARIINTTWNDPRSLNIDLDDFMGSYEEYVRMILHHLHLEVSPRELEEIVDELNFYDINNSPIYRYSQSNPLMNHINEEAVAEKTAIKQFLAEDVALKEFYRPIYELLDTAINDPRSSVGIRNAQKQANGKHRMLAESIVA